ncbi:hypothetical protein OWM07_07620 [Deferribacter thermophilus]|uniref:hypothetical protein n=1 Tax=Deferribacter thermophilus TaxID=53573 RepID=UPI003C17E216
MFKRLIVVVILICSFSFVHADEDITDYLLGVSAFKDHLFDLSKVSLEDYLKNAKDDKKIIFSKYLLYQIYMKEKNYTQASKLIDDLLQVEDKRLDYSKIKQDKVYILSQNDCEKGKSYLLENFSLYTLKGYLKTECNVDKAISNKALKIKMNYDLRLTLLVKLKDLPNEAAKHFKYINIKKMDKKLKKHFALFFYKNKIYDIFWDIYKVYKDSDMVNLALERVWELKNYNSFLKSFEINRKKYKVSNINYCRAYNAQKRLGLSVDCDLIDKCFDRKGEEYFDVSLACRLENGDKKSFKQSYILWSKKSKEIKCKYGYTAYKYDAVSISQLKDCKNRYEIAENLLADEKAKEIILMLSDDKSDEAAYYKVLAYLLLNDLKSAKVVYKKIKDPKIIERLKELMK